MPELQNSVTPDRQYCLKIFYPRIDEMDNPNWISKYEEFESYFERWCSYNKSKIFTIKFVYRGVRVSPYDCIKSIITKPSRLRKPMIIKAYRVIIYIYINGINC